MEKRMSKGRKNSKTSILVTIGIFVVGGVLLFTLVGLVSDIRAAKQEYSFDQAQLDNLHANNDELEIRLSDDGYVEGIARENGYILSGEEVYEDVSGN